MEFDDTIFVDTRLGFHNTLVEGSRVIRIIPVTSDQVSPHTVSSELPIEWANDNGFTAKPGQILAVPDENMEIEKIYVGVSEDGDNLYALSSIPQATSLPAATYVLDDRHSNLDNETVYQMALGWSLGFYNFDKYKQGDKSKPHSHLVIPDGVDADKLKHEAAAIKITRHLINEPANIMTTEVLGDFARDLARHFNVKAAVHVGNSLLADKHDFPLVYEVGKAAEYAPRVVDFTWSGEETDKDAPLITLVGKGIVYDSGGLNLKPGASMCDMKKDMGGAANVLGLATMIMANELPVRLRVLLPIAENSINEKAFRSGDVIYSREDADTKKRMSVEIYNTDAEGRLVLADCLRAGAEKNPDTLIDIATLTGSQRVAHGLDVGAIMGTDRDIIREMEDISESINDPVEGMVLRAEHRANLNSNIADIKNDGGAYAGAQIAGAFLKEFTGAAKNWFHIDINGWNKGNRPGRPEGGEAMAIRTVYRYLENKYG